MNCWLKQKKAIKPLGPRASTVGGTGWEERKTEKEKEKDVSIFNGLSRCETRKPAFCCVFENVRSRGRGAFCSNWHSSRIRVNCGILSTDE